MTKPRILVVEDEPHMARAIAHSLESFGYSPLGPCDRGETAIEVAGRLHPDLVLMDVNLLDDVDGVVVAETIRLRLGIRSVMMTALDVGDVLPRAQKASPVGFINKPFTGPSLHAALQMALHLRDVQAQLFRQQQTLDAMLQNEPDGLIVTDLRGQVLEANASASRLMGLSRLELIGRNVVPLFTRSGDELASWTLKGRLASGASRFVHACMGKGGRQLEVLFSADSENVANNRFVCCVRDVTDRKKAEVALSESEEKYRALVEVTGTGFAILDERGTVIDANAEFVRLSGRKSLKEIQGCCVTEWTRASQRESNGEQIRRCLEIGSVESLEIEYEDDAGKITPIEINATVIETASGRRIMSLCRDISGRRKAEEILRSNEHRLRLALEAGGLGAFEHDLRVDRIMVTPEFCRIVGFPLQASMAHDEWVSRMHADDRKGVVAGVAALFSRQSPALDLEYRICLPDGGTRWIRAMASPVMEAGRVKRVYGVVQDITDRKVSESELRQLSRAVEQSPASIVITDSQGAIEYVNPKFCAVTGYSFEEVRGKNPRILKSGEMEPEVYRQLWAAIAAGKEWHGEFLNRKKNGESYWEAASISPLRDQSGQTTHYIAVKEDITHAKKTARDLELKSSYLLAIIENQPGVVWLRDNDDRFLAVNQAFARIYGRTDATEFVGVKRSTLWPSDHADWLERLDRQLYEQGSVRLSVKVPFPNGTARWTELYESLARDASGAVIGVVGSAREITAERDAERQLLASARELERTNDQLRSALVRETQLARAAEEANRAKTVFLASMSHELRSPLNVINGVSSTMMLEFAGTRQADSAKLILECGEHLHGIITEILDYSVLQGDRAKSEMTPFDLLGVINAVLRQVAYSARQKSLALSFQISPGTPIRLESDPRRLRQILLNLLQNAVKFTAHGGIHLSVTARPLGQASWRWSFSVADSGMGIEREHRTRVFEPFTQATGDIARVYGGTGLGLTISREFAIRLGGDVVVRSRPGKGSCFRCTIVASETAEGATIANLGSPALRGREVRIVTLNARLRRFLVAVMRAWGMRPTICAAQAWEAQPAESGPSPVPCIAERGAISPADAAHSSVIWIEREGSKDQSPVTSVLLTRPIDLMELERSLRRSLSMPPDMPTSLKRDAEAFAPPARLADRIPLRILAADDIRSNREVLRGITGLFGYKPDFCINGAEVIAALARQSYDLILIDVQMPVMDGLAAAREITRLHPDPVRRPKIVALTANALSGDREKCLAAGMDDYLAKPLLPHHLEASILQWFGGEKTMRPPVIAPLDVVEKDEDVALIDEGYLVAAFPGTSSLQRVGVISQMGAAALADYETLMCGLVESCSRCDSPAVATVLHALKGCCLTIGWKRMAVLCAGALLEARAGKFSEWTLFPSKLHELQAATAGEMTRYLRRLSQPDADLKH